MRGVRGPAARHARRPHGFTFPEVLAALVLIGIVLPPVLKGVSLAMGACDDAKRKIEATGLAESKLAELTVDAVQLVSSGGGSGTFPDHPEYTWDAQTIAQDTDLSEITVRVTWTARGTQRTIDLSTFVFTGTTGCSNGFYIEDIAAHEFGHALGLGHSAASNATMYPSTFYCNTANRSLDADDVAGVEQIYGRRATTPPVPPAPTGLRFIRP